MSQRITKKHVEEVFEVFCSVARFRKSRAYNDMGGLKLAWNFNNLATVERSSNTGGVFHPFGELAMTGREMNAALHFAMRVIEDGRHKPSIPEKGFEHYEELETPFGTMSLHPTGQNSIMLQCDTGQSWAEKLPNVGNVMVNRVGYFTTVHLQYFPQGRKYRRHGEDFDLPAGWDIAPMNAPYDKPGYHFYARRTDAAARHYKDIDMTWAARDKFIAAILPLVETWAASNADVLKKAGRDDLAAKARIKAHKVQEAQEALDKAREEYNALEAELSDLLRD